MCLDFGPHSDERLSRSSLASRREAQAEAHTVHFALSALAIVPLAALGHATEFVATKTGDANSAWTRPLNGRWKSSLFFARAFDAQCCLWANLKALGCDFGAAPRALPVGAVLNSRQCSLHRGDLTRNERSLPFERNVILQLERLFGGIGIKRFGQIPCNAILPSFEFGELRLKTALTAAVFGIPVTSNSLRHVHSKS